LTRVQPRRGAALLAGAVAMLVVGATPLLCQAQGPAQRAREPVSYNHGRAEPDLFGFSALKLGSSIYDDIWRDAESSAMPNHNVELGAQIDRLRALPVRSRAAAANAWVNARVAYNPVPVAFDHHWGNLSTTLTSGSGAREDIAIAKLQLLAAAGVARRDLYLVLVRDLRRVRTDALLAVRDGDQFYILDSKQDALISGAEVGHYFPVMAFNSEGQWIFGRRQAQADIPGMSSAD
jgi:predicted transglutaminase-like cysteine proteinase